MLNDAGIYVANVPKWWRLDGFDLPEHKYLRDELLPELLKLAGPSATKPKDVHLFGTYGRGKSSLAIALAYYWGLQGHSAAFKDCDEMMLEVRATWGAGRAKTSAQVYEELFEPKFLVIDDIGKSGGPEKVEVLSTVLNSRINRGKRTAVTSNHDINTPDGLKSFLAACDHRVYERLRGGEFLIAGANLRGK